MPAALNNSRPDDALVRLAPSGGWIGPEPTGYFVHARHAEEALTLAVYCHEIQGGAISARYADRVARSCAELPGLPGLRTFEVLIGRKRGPRKTDSWLATEIVEIGEAAA